MGRQHQGMDRPEIRQVPEGSGEQGKMEKTGCIINCGALDDDDDDGDDGENHCKENDKCDVSGVLAIITVKTMMMTMSPVSWR